MTPEPKPSEPSDDSSVEAIEMKVKAFEREFLAEINSWLAPQTNADRWK